MASRPSSIVGSGTLSQRMSFFPCQVSAFIPVSLMPTGDAGKQIDAGWLVPQAAKIRLA